jgi:energy-coupling factor transporter ATP-binding protein EcfA2
LLKLILGELAPTAGTVRQGTRLEVAYFDQMRSTLKLDATLADTISPGSEWVEFNGAKKHVMSYLNDFLFAPERANSPVRTLSGGERNRVLLARLFALPANVLVLDEPTNDLDIDTLELLEELLQSYAGTVFLVSHDRRFLDNVVTSTIAWEGDEQPGFWREYEGGYEDWKTQRERALALREQVARAAASGKGRPAAPALGAPPASSLLPSTPKPRKLSYKEQREFDALPIASTRSKPSRRRSARCSPMRRSTRRSLIARPPRRRAMRRSMRSCCARSNAGRNSAAAPGRPRRRHRRHELPAAARGPRDDPARLQPDRGREGAAHLAAGDQPADPRARGGARRRPVRARRQAPDRRHRGRHGGRADRREHAGRRREPEASRCRLCGPRQRPASRSRRRIRRRATRCPMRCATSASATRRSC